MLHPSFFEVRFVAVVAVVVVVADVVVVVVVAVHAVHAGMFISHTYLWLVSGNARFWVYVSA